MTRNNRRTVVFAAALAVSAIAGAHAQGWGHHGGHGQMLFGLLDGVTLTDSQQQQIHADMKASFGATRSTRHQLRALEQQIAAAMTSSGSVTSATVTPLIQQEETLRGQLDQARMTLALQIRGVLTAQQLAQAAQAQSQLQSLHQQEERIAHPGATAE
jgi:Spy/CpxP family protein refolding chaperone